MWDILKVKKAGLFAGGVLFGTAGVKLLSSKDAKKFYTNCTAAVLRAKDSLMKTATTVQENAGDILAEAQQINEERAAKEAAEAEIVEETEGAVMACGVDRVDDGHNDYPVFTDINVCDVEVDAIIDFSAAPAVDGLLDFAVERQIPVVLCTTGLSDEQLERVHEASKKTAVLRSANMSLGVNTLFKVLKSMTKLLADAGFDIDIVEKHHRRKLDAPSGTAIALAEAVNEPLNNEYEFVYDRSQRREQRPKKEIGISAVRGGTIVGEHEIIFAGQDEVIELKHTAYSRAIFGKGAVSAALYLAGKEAGMYDMSDVIGL